jgi:hypothetical protein
MQSHRGREKGGRARAVRYAARIGLCSLFALAVVPAVAHAGGALADPSRPSVEEAQEAGRWALAIALAFLVVGVPLVAWIVRWIWWSVAGKGDGGEEPKLWWGRSLVVGQDNRASTSKTAALVWTYTLAAALLSFLIARWLGHPGGLDQLNAQGLNAQYAVLIGGPLGAAILAKSIVSSQVDSGSAAKPAAESASPAQLVQGDSGEADLGDLQYLLFNVVALVFFYGELLRAPQAGLPTIPDVLVGLTSVAAVGFVAKKTLAGPAAISEVRPLEAAVGAHVEIFTAGLIKSEDDLPALAVSFGRTPADPAGLDLTTTTTQGVLIDAVVPPSAAGKVDLEVSVPSGKLAKRPGFKVLPEIEADQDLRGRPGESVEVSTTGVTGLGQRLTGLKVKIADLRAKAQLGDDGGLVVTVPEDAPPGRHEIALTTPGGGPVEAEFRVRD